MNIEGLYKINEREKERLITTFLDAFKDYPKLRISFRGEQVRMAALEATVRYYVAYDMKFGAAFALDSEICEGICVVHSSAMDYTEEKYVAAGCYSKGYRAAMNRLTCEQQERWRALFCELDELEETLDFPKPHLYIDYLGVKGCCQNQGRGRRLMSAVCDYGRQQELPLMLFTNTEEDVNFYKSLGFHVAGVVRSESFGFTNTYLVKEVHHEKIADANLC